MTSKRRELCRAVLYCLLISYILCVMRCIDTFCCDVLQWLKLFACTYINWNKCSISDVALRCTNFDLIWLSVPAAVHAPAVFFGGKNKHESNKKVYLFEFCCYCCCCFCFFSIYVHNSSVACLPFFSLGSLVSSSVRSSEVALLLKVKRKSDFDFGTLF